MTSWSRSRFLDECSRPSSAPFRGSSSPFCLACTWHGEVSGTLRFQFPLREWRQCRRCMGTWNGLIPYSCLVPPRFLTDEWTPLLEPSRRRRRRLPSVRNKTDVNDYDAENHSEVSPWKERSSPFRGQITVWLARSTGMGIRAIVFGTPFVVAS